MLIRCLMKRDAYFERAAIFVISNFPLLERVAWEAVETVFAPTSVAHQLALAVALETGMVRWRNFSNFCTSHFISPFELPRSR